MATPRLGHFVLWEGCAAHGTERLPSVYISMEASESWFPLQERVPP